MSTAHEPEKTSAWQSAVFGFLVCLVGVLQAKPLSFITADLGRHIINGKFMLQNWQIPNINLYSYVEPAFPFVNHHWGSGVIFYLIYAVADFPGLSILAILTHMLTFYLVFDLAYSKGRFDVAMLVGLLVIPLIGTRTEIRPEIFSYLLTAVFMKLCWMRREGNLSNKMLWVFPLLMVLWVNLHIYFFFGCILVAAMVMDEAITVWRHTDRWSKLRAPFLMLVGTGLATFINPSGIWGGLEPLLIFNNYHYAVSENQSVFALEQFMRDGVPVYFKLTIAAMCFAIFRSIYRYFTGKSALWVGGLFPAIVVVALGIGAIRHIVLLAYVAIPVVSILLKDLPEGVLLTKKWLGSVALGAWMLLLIAFGGGYWQVLPQMLGIGLTPNVLDAVGFFRQQNLRGPIFNDYDIGGYLIFGLYPVVPVFTDNRPEAYSASFFNDLYIPMQADENIWKLASEKFGFKTIIMHANNQMDITKTFIQRRMVDPEWVPVFNDRRVIILVRNIPEYANVIRQFSLRNR